MSWDWYNYSPSLSAGEQRRRAEKAATALVEDGAELHPVCVEGNKIAHSFWGKAWCENLESYSDYASRLPRGRSYLRNRCVIDLEIRGCEVEAVVSGSELYTVFVEIAPVANAKWKALKAECAGKIGSLIDLLQGKLSGPVMEIVTRKGSGLFPQPSEISFECTCPDSASMCKHIAATLYGIGTRLDEEPELLFLLRNADQNELVTEAAGSIAAAPEGAAGGRDVLAEDDLASVFGIEFDSARVAETESARPAKKVNKKPAGTGAKSPKKAPARAKKTAKPRAEKVSAPSASASRSKARQVKKPVKKATGAGPKRA